MNCTVQFITVQYLSQQVSEFHLIAKQKLYTRCTLSSRENKAPVCQGIRMDNFNRRCLFKDKTVVSMLFPMIVFKQKSTFPHSLKNYLKIIRLKRSYNLDLISCFGRKRNSNAMYPQTHTGRKTILCSMKIQLPDCNDEAD